MHVNAFGFDKSITIFENMGLRPSSTRKAPDGSLILTIDPAPMVVKLDIAGRMLWKFEERREKGIHTNLTGSLPQADGSVIVCANRESAPGVPFERYPGYLFKLDRNGMKHCPLLATYREIDSL